MSKNWFGKDCKYLCAQWELGESEDNEPVLVFCNHGDNPEDCEGNCRAKVCPLNYLIA